MGVCRPLSVGGASVVAWVRHCAARRRESPVFETASRTDRTKQAGGGGEGGNSHDKGRHVLMHPTVDEKKCVMGGNWLDVHGHGGSRRAARCCSRSLQLQAHLDQGDTSWFCYLDAIVCLLWKDMSRSRSGACGWSWLLGRVGRGSLANT